MRKTLLLLIPLLTLFSFTLIHEYYVSITKIDYVKEQKSLQITSRLFVDDLELALKKQYGDTLVIDDKKYEKRINNYIGNYLKRFTTIKINDNPMELNFLGKEYDNDIIICYLEIENVESINSIQVSNRVLLDVYEEQENIVRTNINSKHKTFILNRNNTLGNVKY